MYLKAIIVNIMEFDIQTTYGLKGPFNAKNKPFFSLKIQAWRQEFRAPVSVFICIDKSGSMQNTWKNVLKAFEWLLRKSSLDTTDSFAVVLFSDDVETIMELTPYSEESVTMVLSMLQKHLPNGGTNLNGALKEMIRMMDEKYAATLQTNSQATLQTNSQATLQTNSFANSSGICCIITDGEPSTEYGGPIDIMNTMQRKYKTSSRSNISSVSSAFTPYRSKMTAATSAACDAACDAGKSALARYLQHHGLSLLLRGQDVAGVTRILARADLSKVKTIVWDLAANESSIPWELVADLASGVIGGRNTPAVLVPPTPTVVLARCPPDTDCKCRLLAIEGSILYDDC